MGEKGKKKSRILLIVCGLLLLAGAIIGIVMFRMQAGASAYNESIKTAEKYADSGEYELAVLTYENAIKDRPKEEEGISRTGRCVFEERGKLRCKSFASARLHAYEFFKDPLYVKRD